MSELQCWSAAQLQRDGETPVDKLATALTFAALRFLEPGPGVAARPPCLRARLARCYLLLPCLTLLSNGRFPRLVRAPVPSEGLLRFPSRPMARNA